MGLSDIGKMVAGSLFGGIEGAEPKGDADPAAIPGAPGGAGGAGGVGSTVGGLVGSIFGPIGGAVGGVAGKGIEALTQQKAPSGPGATIESGHVGAGGQSGDDMVKEASRHLGKIAQRGLTNKAAASGYGKVF